MAKTVFVMGVSGCGKSTIGILLAERMGTSFFDGDYYHPKENIEKMSQGIPLNDDDRQGWLKALNALAKTNVKQGAVIACSALKESYRAILKKDIGQDCRFLYLEGSFDEINERLDQRKGHFMTAELLKSQFDTLEVPKDAITVSIMDSPEEIVTQTLEKL